MNCYVSNSKSRWILNQVLCKVQEEQMLHWKTMNVYLLSTGQGSMLVKKIHDLNNASTLNFFSVFSSSLLPEEYTPIFNVIFNIPQKLANLSSLFWFFFWLLHISILFSCLSEVSLMHFGLILVPKTILPQFIKATFNWQDVKSCPNLLSDDLPFLEVCPYLLSGLE